MGYETKLIIGITTSSKHDNVPYFMEYASIDLCKCGNRAKINDIKLGHEVFIYDGSENKITEDCYGDKLRAFPIEIALKALKHDVNIDVYRRFKWGYDLLKSMAADKEESLEVITYGH